MTYGYLMHHGVKGMRWGVRNYQNPDGTLTAEGRRHYHLNNDRRVEGTIKDRVKMYTKQRNKINESLVRNYNQDYKTIRQSTKGNRALRKEQIKKLDREYEKHEDSINKVLQKKYGSEVMSTAERQATAKMIAGTLVAIGAIGVTDFALRQIAKNY